MVQHSFTFVAICLLISNITLQSMNGSRNQNILASSVMGSDEIVPLIKNSTFKTARATIERIQKERPFHFEVMVAQPILRTTDALLLFCRLPEDIQKYMLPFFGLLTDKAQTQFINKMSVNGAFKHLNMCKRLPDSHISPRLNFYFLQPSDKIRSLLTIIDKIEHAKNFVTLTKNEGYTLGLLSDSLIESRTKHLVQRKPLYVQGSNIEYGIQLAGSSIAAGLFAGIWSLSLGIMYGAGTLMVKYPAVAATLAVGNLALLRASQPDEPHWFTGILTQLMAVGVGMQIHESTPTFAIINKMQPILLKVLPTCFSVYMCNIALCSSLGLNFNKQHKLPKKLKKLAHSCITRPIHAYSAHNFNKEFAENWCILF